MDRKAEAAPIGYNLSHQTTSFIGREQEIEDILNLLDHADCQLLTLTGPGGIGKTRLALEVARRIGHRYADGVYFIPLQSLRSADYLPAAIIHVLGLPVHADSDLCQQLQQYLSRRRLVLFFDNFEHLLDGTGLIADLAAAAPEIKLLVTSREALNLHEEWRWPVQGLPFPHAETEDIETYSAIRLFIERARQIQPDFRLAEHRAAVIRICQQLEGIPLAIELAAGWIRTLDCDTIAHEIQKDLDFLTSRERNIPERHRSMRAVYNHSWRLLFEDERRVFQNLSVFHGGFTRAAAETVATASLTVLAALVDKSLVRQDAADRYDIHELLRQYGAELLAEYGEADAVAARHARYFADFMDDCQAQVKGPQQLAVLDRIEADFENIRAAWSYAVAHQAYPLVERMMDTLTLFGYMRSRFVETNALFEVARDAFAPAPGDHPHPVWGRVLIRAPRADVTPVNTALEMAQHQHNDTETAFCLKERGIYYAYRGQYAHAFDDLQNSLNIYRRLEDHFGMATAAANLIHLTMVTGDWEAAQTYIELGMRLALGIGSLYHQYWFLFYAGWKACYDGCLADAECHLQEAVTLAKTLGFRVMAADSVGSLGFVAFLRGDFEQSRAWIIEDLETTTQVKAPGEQGFARIVLGHLACVEERYHEAKMIAEEALALVQPNQARERFIIRILAMAACGLGDFDQARHHLRALLVQETRPGTRLLCIPLWAILLAHEGRLQWAAELLGLAFTHPASARGWLEHWPLLTRLRAQLTAQLREETFTAAWGRGSQLDLDTVIEQLLVVSDVQTRQPLIEPLTDRELEILRLVADGLSNRAIAETLTIVEGTVKTHVHNLCQKLSASNRTQLTARARVLGILP